MNADSIFMFSVLYVLNVYSIDLLHSDRRRRKGGGGIVSSENIPIEDMADWWQWLWKPNTVWIQWRMTEVREGREMKNTVGEDNNVKS